MTEEQIRQGQTLMHEIWKAEQMSKSLENAVVAIEKNSSAIIYGSPEDEIELLPQEQEALASTREAYLDVLRSANNRKLNKARKEFEEL